MGALLVLGAAFIAFGLKAFAAMTMASGGLNLIIPGILAATALIYAAFRKGETEAEKFNKKVQELNENIKQNQVDIYNYRKTTTELEQLIERYEELDNQVVKTAEELDEMNDILEQIDKYSTEDKDFVINGKFNQDLKDYIEIMKADLKKAEDDSVTLGGETLKAYAESLLDDTKDFDFNPSNTTDAITYMAQSLTGAKDLFEMTAEDQEDIFDLIRSN